MMTTKYTAAMAALTIAGAAVAQTNTPEQKLPRPNVLFIVVDDLGWSDVSYNGSTLVPTPNIDRIAKMGVSFTDAYVTAPISGPSRNGMVSGMYSQKYGMQINADLKAAEVPAKQMTLPETMRAAGYRTALVGKWHVCRQPEPIFDEVYQRIDISSNYFPDSIGNYDGRRLPILATAEPKDENEYMTDRLANYAIKFMNKQDESQPFFLYLGFNAVHNPWQACKKYYDKLSYINDEHMRVHASILASVDENIGILLNYLDNRGLTDNTIITFISDNGPAKGGPELKTWEDYDPSREYVFGQMKTLRGHKVDLYEGGIRTPMAIAYKPLFREGKVFTDMISSMDFYPTICELAGAEIPEGTELDGVSLVRHLCEETKQQPHDILYWCRNQFGAARMGVWKFYKEGDKEQLFNLREDISETTDVSDKYPHIKARLSDAWKKWHSQIPVSASKVKNKNNNKKAK